MERIREYIKKNNLLNQGDNLIVGLSGGSDSVCLLFVLGQLSKEYNLSVHAVHVNHMIRSTADRDEEFSRDFAERMNVGYTAVKIDCVSIAKSNGLSLEEAGRNERYRIFEETGRKVFGEGRYKIAVAHHSDDLTETFLFNLARGTGIKGLSSLRAQNGIIIRPLLCVNKKEIEEILNSYNLSHVEDETNSLNEYSRNKIRNSVLPIMNEVNNCASFHIVQTAGMLCEIDDYMTKETDMAWNEYVRVLPHEVILPEKILSLHPAITKRIIHKALSLCAGRAKDISSVQTEAVLELFDKQVGKRRDLIYGMTSTREYDGVHIYKNAEENELNNTLNNVTFDILERDFSKEIPVEMYTKWMDYDKISNCPVVRFRQKGDYLYVADNARKLLSDYMINEKIPEKIRDSIPLVADGNHILWVIGYRISSAVKVSDETRKILTVHYEKQE